jgi:glyoxylase-like metal-dependent hydrolase (beta-lactamase superfamily II)/rhodanese-related sulfurtransferase
MKVEQIYTGCLAEAAYYVESNGECAIIDPLRDTAPYIKKAAKDGATIKYIFETHFHADFVSGHLELAQKTGAAIVYGAGAQTDFESIKANDGDEFKIGAVTIRALHTPGHTPESTTYLLLDENAKPYCIFTGDTLFIGDVGRPDLAIKSNVTKEDLAGMLYQSLHTKILPLPDDVIVYPAHGAGSACGKSMSKETFDTLGHQKQVNYALQNITQEEFVKQVTDGLLPPPQYFSKNAMLNKQGAGSLEDVYVQGLQQLDPLQFIAVVEETGALVLDTRDPQVFAKAFIPKSINIGLNGQFAVWVGTLVSDLKQPILLVCEEGKEQECVMRLARVGYDNTIGYLSGGIQAWKEADKELDSITSVTAEEFASRQPDNLNVLDVRRPGEFEVEHVQHAQNKPLDFINDWTTEVHRNETYYVHCAGGYRSMVAASILKARGFENIVEVAGGYGAIAKTNVPKQSLIEQTN